jgi:hypothetical protein
MPSVPGVLLDTPVAGRSFCVAMPRREYDRLLQARRLADRDVRTESRM